MSDSQKAKSKSVSLFPALWEKVEKKAKSEYSGNRSNYIRELIEADLEADPETNTPELTLNKCIIEIAHQFLPRHVPYIARNLEGRDQGEILEQFLKTLSGKTNLDVFKDYLTDLGVPEKQVHNAAAKELLDDAQNVTLLTDEQRRSLDKSNPVHRGILEADDERRAMQRLGNRESNEHSKKQKLA